MRKLYIIIARSSHHRLEDLGVDNMKEYKVGFIKLVSNPDKNTDKIESLLNEMAGKGWEFKFEARSHWIFEREK